MVAALHGEAAPWDFAGKFALTLLVLGCGFKGGEIMPVMCMGACLGCTLGHAMGADAGACAAVGLVAMLAAASNCPSWGSRRSGSASPRCSSLRRSWVLSPRCA